MQNYLIMCKSLTYAQRAARALERSGITASITKLPQAFSQDGCGYSVKVQERWLTESLQSMQIAGITPGKIYKRETDGVLREVYRQ